MIDLQSFYLDGNEKYIEKELQGNIQKAFKKYCPLCDHLYCICKDTSDEYREHETGSSNYYEVGGNDY